jgi:hypothetical protein
MAKEKNKTEVEQLQEELAAAKATVKEQQDVINGQATELEKLGAEKKAKAPVIVHRKKKYAVRAVSAMIKVDGQMKKLQLIDAKGEKAVEDHDLDALLKIEGQKVLEKV